MLSKTHITKKAEATSINYNFENKSKYTQYELMKISESLNEPQRKYTHIHTIHTELLPFIEFQTGLFGPHSQNHNQQYTKPKEGKSINNEE